MQVQHSKIFQQCTGMVAAISSGGTACIGKGDIITIHVLLHELGHLIHIKATGTLTEIPTSFWGRLPSLGIGCSKLTAAQLLELFSDTFMLAIINKRHELEVPEPDFSAKTLARCYKHICTLFDSMK